MPHRSDLYLRWALELKRKRFFHAGERVGVAVSGGPDSMLLLHFMRHFARDAALSLAVVHFNHKLRGEESDSDEQFVREQAEEMGIEFLRSEPESAEELRAPRRNLEAAARDLRYRFFLSLIHRGKLEKIVTGHTANDQAETVLLRLLRGSGTRGLGGIYPSLGGKILRPFLTLTREEIVKELQERRLTFRVDSTNRDTRFLRNKIRLELLPLLAKEFNPEVASLLQELSDRARDDEEALEQLAHERALPWRVREGTEEKIPVRALLELPAAIQRRVLRQMVAAVKGNLRSINHRQVEAMRQLAADAPSGRKLLFPGALEARKEFDWLVVAPAAASPAQEFHYPLKVPGEVSVPELGVIFRLKLNEAEGQGKTYNSAWTGGLDPQKLPGKLKLRNWRPGDRFRPLGSQKSRKLKELLSRHKIPASARRWWPVLESGTEIVWVRGFPPASPVAATATSKQVLLVEEVEAPRSRGLA